jgi:hypothetical protein
MIYLILKVVITTGLVVAISEISRRSTLLGGILASVPLISVLALIWLYVDTKDDARVIQLSTSVFWLVLPSLSLFLLLPVLLRHGVAFVAALPISLGVMVLLYFAMVWVLGRFGVAL